MYEYSASPHQDLETLLILHPSDITDFTLRLPSPLSQFKKKTLTVAKPDKDEEGRTDFFKKMSSLLRWFFCGM